MVEYLEKQLKEKDEEIRALQHKKLDLLDTVGELKADPSLNISKRDKKTYLSTTRMLIYDAVVQQVPTTNIPSLVCYWSQKMGMQLADIPQQHSVELMARELGTISSLQAAEVAMRTPCLTLGFDATTQEGVHINSVHLTTVDKCLVVAVD